MQPKATSFRDAERADVDSKWAVTRAGSLTEACQALLAALSDPAKTSNQVIVSGCLAVVCEELRGLPKKDWSESLQVEMRALWRMSDAVGARRMRSSEQRLALAEKALASGSASIWSVLFSVNAWELAEPPRFEAIPPAMWGDFASWVFAEPCDRMLPEEKESYARTWLVCLKELAGWCRKNPGSKAVRAAVDAYLRVHRCSAWFPNLSQYREEAKMRAAILGSRSGLGRVEAKLTASPREGRSLRVGLLTRTAAPSPGLFAGAAYVRHLDPRKFDVSVVTMDKADDCARKLTDSMGARFYSLPETPASRVEALRSLKLDVAVFAGDLIGTEDPVMSLASQRIAPLQLTLESCMANAGFPELDLQVCGDAASDGSLRSVARAGILRGGVVAYDFLDARADGTAADAKAALGLSEGAVALAAVATPGIGSSVLLRWAEILALAPQARLLVCAVGEDDNWIAGLCERIELALRRWNVATDRVSVFPQSGSAAWNVANVYLAADVFLDSTGSEHPSWLAGALAAGLPAVALVTPGDAASENAADPMRVTGLAALVAANSEDYVCRVANLVLDGQLRAQYSASLREKVEGVPLFLDSLAASDAFGALIETGFDELCSLGADEFRRQDCALVCFGSADVKACVAAGIQAYERGDIDTAVFESAIAIRTLPGDPTVRYLQGLVLSAQSEPARASEYLLAAVNSQSADPAAWLALARALRDSRRIPQAIEALEICVRRDPHHAEAMFMLLELAEGVGAHEITEEVRSALLLIAPQDPRLLATV